MRAHPDLTLIEVVSFGPSKIAQMVASEFWRASSSANNRSRVLHCYERAKELMGVLEIVEFPSSVAVLLKPFYYECLESKLRSEPRLKPGFVRSFSTHLARSFDQAAFLIEGMVHA